MNDNAIALGIIGYDTSHTPAFTRLLNDTTEPHHVPGARVVAGYPSYSADIAASRERVDGFRQEMRALGVPEVDGIAALIDRVDALLLESVDGRRHLREATPVLEAGLPVFVDKPLAASYDEAQKIVDLARASGTPLFSSSSLRYDVNLRSLLDEELGAAFACDAFSPATLEPTNPGLFWYGVHGVEILYTFLGPGCRSVTCHTGADGDLVVARWADGRIGTMRGTRRGAHEYGATLFAEGGVRQATYSRQVPLYAQLLQQIVAFFRSERQPVPLNETLEIMAFMQAALVSSREGRQVALEEVRC